MCHLLLYFVLCVVQLIIAEPAALTAKQYLENYGYLTVDPAAAADSAELLKHSILKFQGYVGLPRTGVLDDLTTETMQAPRCGLPDISHKRNKRYAVASRWRKRNLSYAILQYAGNVTHERINDVIASSFAMWQKVVDLTLTKVDSEQSADLRLSFLKGSHSTSRTTHIDQKLAFDGPGGVLAHASFPTVGEIHFDDAEYWLTDGAASEGQIGYSLMWAAVHELGHALGLKHTHIAGNIMNPMYRTTNNLVLGDDDITGIRRLYGKAKPDKIEKDEEEEEEESVTSEPVTTPSYNCSESETVDAVLTIGKTMYMFEGEQVWEFSNSTTQKPPTPQAISDVFPGIEGPITAAMAGINNKIYFFRNKLYWRYDTVRGGVDRGYPRSVVGFGYIYDDVIAAFRWNVNGKGYIFGKGRYWRYDFWTKRVDPGYPRATRMWRGVPDDVGAMTTGPDLKTYVFQNKSYWIYSGTEYRVLPQKYSTSQRWRTCIETEVDSEELRVSDLTASGATSGYAAFSILLSVLSLHL